MRTVRSWYGNVQIPRIYCRKCQSWSFVLEGKRQCCNRPTETAIVKIKRMTNTEAIRRKPPKHLQEVLLLKFQECCAYCERGFGTWVHYHERPTKLRLEWDHQLPFAYLQSNPQENFLPACHVCNRWKSSLMFQTLEEVKVYVTTKWEKEHAAS